MSGRRHSLRSRITMVTLLVAVVAVAITGFAALQFVRASTTDEARSQLAAQAEILARVPRLVSAAELADKASLALGGTQVALVLASGKIDGDAAPYVDAPILRRLAVGSSVSTTRRGSAGLVMVEARPTRDGRAVVLALPLSSVDRAVGQVTGRVLLALGIGLIVAIVGGTVLARLLSRPLSETAVAARRLASGERGVPMPKTGTAEVADVADALATLDTALAASEGRQREFLLSVSHELRTPLTAVRGYAEAMADGLIAADQVTTVGNTLVAETERLDRFVGDLLELARLEADDFSISPVDVDLTALLDQVVAAWSGRAATLGVELSAVSTADMVETDPRRLRQVIDGLVENAMRVTPAGSAIELRATEGSLIQVIDGGPGLADADLAVAFERGVLGDRYRDIRPVGTGLGLSIAARLVERLGGTITVANRPEGGAVFSVMLGSPMPAPAGTTGRNASRGS